MWSLILIFIFGKFFTHQRPCPYFCLGLHNINFENCNSFLTIFLYYIFIFYFFFGCIGSSLLRAGFLQLRQVRSTLCCGVWASHCSGFSLLQSMGSRHVDFSSCGTWAQQLWLLALEHRLSSCGARAQLLHGMWDLPGPGPEPVSPALAGGFLTTALPEKPFLTIIN